MAPPAWLARAHRGLDRPCHGRRPREMPGSGLRRLPCQTGHPAGLRDVLTRYLGQAATAAGDGDGRQDTGTGPVGLLEGGPLDAATVARLVGGFAQELPERAVTIENALRSQDLHLVKELAHQLKGSAGLYGFTQIADAARMIHQRATEEEDLEQLQAAVGDLVQLCEQTRARQPSSHSA